MQAIAARRYIAPSNYGEAQLTDDEFIASEGKKIKVNCGETVQC